MTHDQEEAFEVADRVVVMNQGRIEQVGSPDEVFAHPANAFVMDFLGSVNVFHGRVQNGRARVGTFEIPFPDHPQNEAQAATAYVRPHELDIDRQAHGEASVAARVLRVSRSGSVVKLSLAAKDDAQLLEVELDHQRDRELNLSVGDEVFVYPHRVRIFVQDEAAERVA